MLCSMMTNLQDNTWQIFWKKKLQHIYSLKRHEIHETQAVLQLFFSTCTWKENIFKCTLRNVTTIYVPIKSITLLKSYLENLEEGF